MISLERIRQRKLFQWSIAYLAAAWLVLQVLDLLAQPFAWPVIVLRTATVLLGAGLIAVLVLAWYHGEQGQQHVSSSELGILALLLVLASVAVWWVRGDPEDRAGPNLSIAPIPSVPEQNSIAVLPFTDLSPARDQEYFSDGMTDELLNALAKVSALRVAARTSSFSFKGRNVPVDEIGQRLRVAHVLEGSVRKASEQVRITVQLINTASGYHLWSETFDRELKDIFALQEEISQTIVAKLQLQLVGQPSTLVAAATANQDAYESYLKGRFFWGSRTPDGLRKAVDFFEQAIANDSAYARAYAGLADALMVLPLYTNARPADVQPRAKAAAEKAVTLDPTLGEAYTSLAYVRMSYDRDWRGAGEMFQKALQVTPNYATTSHWYGDYLAAQGRVAEGVQYYERAARIDPLAAVITFGRAWGTMALHRYDEAIALFHAALELDPTLVDAHTHLARTLLFQGRHAEAIDSLETAVDKSGRRAMELAFLGYGYAVVNRRTDALRIITELNTKAASEYVSPLCQAIVYIGLADLGNAFDWLERTRKANDPWFTENGFDLMFDPLRTDPHWVRLRKRMGLGP